MPRPSVVHDYESQKGSDMVSKVIETQDLTVNYGGHRGIIDVNLYVDKGEVFGFLGPNGAGKDWTAKGMGSTFADGSGTSPVNSACTPP